MSGDELSAWLKESRPDRIEELFQKAYEVKVAEVGRKVFFRGIVEFSSHCGKDCLYCGIRRSNRSAERFEMSDEEILECIAGAIEMEYGSVVLQAGERNDAAFTRRIEQLLQEIRRRHGGDIGITLSLGEQSEETYRRWYDAGANRYLLRIETSSKRLYRTLHPESHSYEERLSCFRRLRDLGYQAGTGVMIGFPGQTSEDLAEDILFFERENVDMIGMGPYIPHGQTPLGAEAPAVDSKERLLLALKMIALVRLQLPDVNIAATTALQALDPVGREKGLQAGANIIMPNITHTRYRKFYQLYDNKPCVDENAGMCRSCLNGRILSIGETVGYNERGDAPHFFRRMSSSDIVA